MIELLMPAGLPLEIKNLFTCSYYQSLSPGADLIANMPGLSAPLKSAYSGKFYKPLVEGTPYFQLYSEAKGQLGLNFFLPFKEKWLFNFKTYFSQEAMTKFVLSYSSLKEGWGTKTFIHPR